MNSGYGVSYNAAAGGNVPNVLKNGDGTTNGGGTYTIPAGITIVQFFLDGLLKQEGDGWSYSGTTLAINPDIAGVYFSYNYTI